MVIGLLTLELFFPDSHSLKDKRSLTRPLLERVRRDWNVSATEVGHRDAWQRATIAIACVNTEIDGAHRALAEIVRHVEGLHAWHLLDYSTEIL